jgi:hypothetical protein
MSSMAKPLKLNHAEIIDKPSILKQNGSQTRQAMQEMRGYTR